MTAADKSREELFQLVNAVANNAPLVIFSIDKEGIFTMSEGKGLGKLSLKPGQVVGMNARDVYKDNEEVLNCINSALAGKETTSQLKVNDALFQTTMSPIHDANGAVTGLVGVATDVTELEDAKAALSKRNEELNKMVMTMVGREKTMMEMKRELRILKGEPEESDDKA